MRPSSPRARWAAYCRVVTCQVRKMKGSVFRLMIPLSLVAGPVLSHPGLALAGAEAPGWVDPVVPVLEEEAQRTGAAEDAEALDEDALPSTLKIWNAGMDPWHPALAWAEHTSPELTVELAPDETLIIPAHLAEQRVSSVQEPIFLTGLGECALVGLRAWTDGVGIPQAYVLAYTEVDGRWQVTVELPLRMYFDRMETIRLGETEALVIYGASGMHFTDLWVYTFEEGKPQLLLETGSAAGVWVRRAMGRDPATVWVGIENWADPEWSYAYGERLWNVYAWTGNEFRFSEELSTTRETAVTERTEGYVSRVLEYLEKPAAKELEGGHPGAGPRPGIGSEASD